jgi:hypothetical protein
MKYISRDKIAIRNCLQTNINPILEGFLEKIRS